MKNALLLVIFQACCYTLFSQELSDVEDTKRIDGIVNEYERKFRLELNVTDSSYVDKLVAKVNESSCSVCDSVLSLDNISKAVKGLFAARIVEKRICLENILNHVYFYDSYGDGVGSRRSYPIAYANIERYKHRECALKNLQMLQEQVIRFSK